MLATPVERMQVVRGAGQGDEEHSYSVFFEWTWGSGKTASTTEIINTVCTEQAGASQSGWHETSLCSQDSKRKKGHRGKTITENIMAAWLKANILWHM